MDRQKKASHGECEAGQIANARGRRLFAVNSWNYTPYTQIPASDVQ